MNSSLLVQPLGQRSQGVIDSTFPLASDKKARISGVSTIDKGPILMLELGRVKRVLLVFKR